MNKKWKRRIHDWFNHNIKCTLIDFYSRLTTIIRINFDIRHNGHHCKWWIVFQCDGVWCAFLSIISPNSDNSGDLHTHTNNVYTIYINSHAVDTHMLCKMFDSCPVPIFILVVDNEWECDCEMLAIKLIFVSNKSLYYWWEFSIFKLLLWNCIKFEMYVCLNIIKYTAPASNRHQYTGSSFVSIALNRYMKHARVYVFASFIIRLKWTEMLWLLRDELKTTNYV